MEEIIAMQEIHLPTTIIKNTLMTIIKIYTVIKIVALQIKAHFILTYTQIIPLMASLIITNSPPLK
jgi:hypothetical protein